jgi:branched-chain amino acid transport system permease protein
MEKSSAAIAHTPVGVERPGTTAAGTWRWAATLLAIAVAVALPFTLRNYHVFELTLVMIYAIAVLGLNILTGYNGQISLGNGAFMAVGSYATALLTARLGVPYLLTIPIGAVAAFVVGLLVGIPALRLRGIYLALATFALALAVTPILNNYDKFTGGHTGVFMKPIHPAFGIPLSNEQWLYFFDWTILFILFVPAWLLIRSRTGRAWMAIRDSETAAEANGIILSYYKTLAFGVSALYAGVAGSLLVINVAYANPDAYNLALSLQLLIGVVVGGLAYVWGPILGGIVVVWLPFFAERIFKVKPDIGFGVFLIAVVFLAPNGLAGLIHRVTLLLRRREPSEVAMPGVMEATPAEADQITT